MGSENIFDKKWARADLNCRPLDFYVAISVEHSNQAELRALELTFVKSALDQTRTGDLMVNSHALYLLSYEGI